MLPNEICRHYDLKKSVFSVSVITCHKCHLIFRLMNCLRTTAGGNVPRGAGDGSIGHSLWAEVLSGARRFFLRKDKRNRNGHFTCPKPNIIVMTFLAPLAENSKQKVSIDRTFLRVLDTKIDSNFTLREIFSTLRLL